MSIRVEENKWILFRHTSKFEIIKILALDIKNNQSNVSKEDINKIKKRLELADNYKSRNAINKQLSTIENKIKTLEFWMFGYKDIINGNRKFIFSPLGNLFLKYIEDDEKCRKIFISMLFGLQFQHPNSKTNECFQLYPFRLILKLLTEARLDYKLYDVEYTLLLPFVKTINEKKYEELINRILNVRSKNNIDKKVMLKQNEHLYVNSYYEWQFTKTLFNQIGIFNEYASKEVICELYHPLNENSTSAPTKRIIRNSYITLSNTIIDFVIKMLTEYSLYEIPLKLNDESALYIDTVKAIYNFYPQILLDEINESDEIMESVMKIPKLIEEYANNNNNEQAYLFEDVLVKAFNLFINIEANGIGGADNTDIECQYLVDKTKFAVEAKSTSNKLSGVNAGRLNYHRLKIGGQYTIVVTPRYVPAALRDIIDSKIVLLKANTLTEFLYNSLIFNPRNIDYTPIHNVVRNNLGTDISKKISDLTFEKFAI